MHFADRLTLDAPRRTADGYLVTRARAARAGVYEYLGREVDPKGERFAADAVVNVYRPAAEVFDQASVASFLMKPVTNNHPRDAVTADNWRQHAKGVVGKALRDGEHLAFDLVLMDAATIADVEAGKRELSNGYGCELSFEDGKAPDGTAYQAVQRQIRGNHVAVVDRGRAGASCRIGDAAICDALASPEIDRILADQRTYVAPGDGGINPLDRSDANDPTSGAKALSDGGSLVATKTITFDGLPLEVTDAAEAAINKLITQRDAAASAQDEANKALTDAKTAHDKAMAAKDTEIDGLKAQVIDQAAIDKLADAKAAVVTDAKAIAGDKLADTAGKTVAEVRRMAVAARLGDAAIADKSDDYIEARFDGLKDSKPGDPLRKALTDGITTNVNDDEKIVADARAAMIADLKGVKPATAA